MRCQQFLILHQAHEIKCTMAVKELRIGSNSLMADYWLGASIRQISNSGEFWLFNLQLIYIAIHFSLVNMKVKQVLLMSKLGMIVSDKNQFYRQFPCFNTLTKGVLFY